MAKLTQGVNDLATLYPDIAIEWHPTLNAPLTPADITAKSSHKVWWQGASCGHEWQAIVFHRTGMGYGCPYCSNHRVLPGFNDLATRFSDVAAEWHPTLNGDLTPADVLSKSSRKVWWQDSHGHEYQARIDNRTGLHSGCPYCAGKKILPGFNDLASQYPDIAAEWHPTKNKDLTPQDVTWSSGRKVWWLDSVCGHEYQATVAQRTQKGTSCVFCSSSHGEKAISRILDDLGISHLHDKSIPGCEDARPLRHDFILLDGNRIVATIEYNGVQHYKPTSFSNHVDASASFFDVRKRDIIKTRWLTSHGIPQLIISYEDYDDIASLIAAFLSGDPAKQSLVIYSEPIHTSIP